MELMKILFFQILVMFVYIVIGFILIKTKLINRDGSKQLSKILVYLITPIVVINAYANMENTTENTTGLLISLGLSAISLLLSMTIAGIFFGKKHKIERFGASFSNAGFMGVPLVMAVIGTEGVFYLSAFITLITVLQMTYGIYTITESKSVISLKSIVTNPIVISFVFGIVLYVLGGFGLTIPTLVSDQLSIVSKMIGPFAMIILGTYVARLSWKDLIIDKMIYIATLFRLVIIPLFVLFLFMLVPEKYYTIALVIMIVSSAPVGINTAIFAELYDIENKQAVAEISVSTILAIFSMPLMIGLVSLLW